jgi:hypothetical protein
MNIEDIRLVADVHTFNYHGYIKSHNTVYFLQVKTETHGKWRTVDVVKIGDLSPDERAELVHACSQMASSALRENAAG